MLALTFACIVYYISSTSGSREVSVCECQSKRITHPRKPRSWPHCASLWNLRSQEVWSKEIFLVRLISYFSSTDIFGAIKRAASTEPGWHQQYQAVPTWIKWVSIMWWRSWPPGLIATLTIKTHTWACKKIHVFPFRLEAGLFRWPSE